MNASLVIEIVALCLTALGMVVGGVWIVANVKATTTQLIQTVKALTASVNRLAERIDELEHDHADTRERVAKLEGSSS